MDKQEIKHTNDRFYQHRLRTCWSYSMWQREHICGWDGVSQGYGDAIATLVRTQMLSRYAGVTLPIADADACAATDPSWPLAPLSDARREI